MSVQIRQIRPSDHQSVISVVGYAGLVQAGGGLLGWLPPATEPDGRRGSRRGRNIADMAQWWSIEVMHGEVSAFRWQEQPT